MDRKEAINALKFINLKSVHPFLSWEEMLEVRNMAIAALQEPEIVYCKDCRLRKTEECAMQYECDCGEQHSWENDNDYCSWGKR